MRLAVLVETSRAIARTRKRLEKIDHLARLFSALRPDEIEVGVAYLAGQIPQGRIGIGYAKIRDTSGIGAAREPTVELLDVHRTLDAIVATTGAGSVKKRTDLLGGMFARATEDEQDFLRRLLMGGIRQGALESIAIEGLAKATDIDAAKIRRAQMLANDLGGVAKAVLTEGEGALSRFDLRLFTPVQPMLAHTAEGVVDALDKLEEAIFELKLDGARVQVHKDGDDVRVFSRRMNDVTPAVPEIVEATRTWPVRSIILDGETIALLADGTPYAFQTTMRRFGRRLDVEKLRKELPLTSYYFDVLYLDGETLIDRPGARPRERDVGAAAGRPDRARDLLRSGRRAGLPGPHDRARARGRHGEGARRPLRGGEPRCELAEAQAGPHARPRGPRRGVGERPA